MKRVGRESEDVGQEQTACLLTPVLLFTRILWHSPSVCSADPVRRHMDTDSAHVQFSSSFDDDQFADSDAALHFLEFAVGENALDGRLNLLDGGCDPTHEIRVVRCSTLGSAM